VTKDFGENKLVYGELTHDFPIIKDMVTYFVIEPEGENSKLTIEGHSQNPSFFSKIALFMMNGFLSKTIKRMIADIKLAVEEEPIMQ
jgi:hypothetical protein